MRRLTTTIILLTILFACASIAEATQITVSSFQTPATYRTQSNSATLRIYSNDTFTDSTGKLIVAAPGGPVGFYLTTTCSIANNVMTCATFNLPSTTDSSKVNATFTGVLYDARGAQIATLFSRWRIPHTLGGTISYEQLESYNHAPPQPDAAVHKKEQFKSLVASVLTGVQETKMTDTIFGVGILYEAAEDVDNPLVVGPNSIFINSDRTQANAALLGGADGLISKLTDKNRGQVYDNGVTTTRANLGVFNVKDFGARDNGTDDSAASIQAAIDAAFAEGGGVVRLSYSTTGVYIITTPIVYKQGVILEGETSEVLSKVRLKLTTASSNAITVGENLINVHIRNLELFTDAASNTGILFTGSGANATQAVTLDGITINGYTRSISVIATDPTKVWQMSYATGKNLILYDCDECLYLDSINTDWVFDNLLVYGRKDSYAVRNVKGGTLQFNHPNFLGGVNAPPSSPCSGGVPTPNYGEAAFLIEGHHGAITIINAQQEGFRNTLINNREDWTYPITFINTVMAAPVKLNQDTNFVSIGNYYYDDTVQATGDTRIYSMGDSIDSHTHCGDPGTGVGGFTLSGGAFIVGRQTIHGTDHQMPVSINAAAPGPTTSDPNNPTVPLFNIGSPTDSHIFMRLGQTNATTRAFTANRYDISRDSNGLLYIFGSQAVPNRGLRTNGVFKLAGTSAAALSDAGNAVINYNATTNRLQWSFNASAYANFLGATATLTTNRLPKVSANPILADSLFSDDGTNAQLVSGLFRFHGATSSFPALKRNGATLEVRCADDVAYCSFAALNAVFSGTLRVGGGATVNSILSGTASLDFTALAAHTCQVLTITVTGAADGDVVSLGVPNSLADADGATERTTFYGWVSAANTVSVRRCNVTTSSTANPTAATVRAQVTKL